MARVCICSDLCAAARGNAARPEGTLPHLETDADILSKQRVVHLRLMVLDSLL